MRLAVANANAQELSRAAHTLKGTSNQVGALRLARVCLQLEKSSWEGTLDGALAQIELVEEEYQRAALELKK
jgi:HPt (histidine-containing phosphotransfer) domain-containing protein